MPTNFQNAQMVTVIHRTLKIIYRSLLVARAARTNICNLFSFAHSILLRFAAQSFNAARFFMISVLMFGLGLVIFALFAKVNNAHQVFQCPFFINRIIINGKINDIPFVESSIIHDGSNNMYINKAFFYRIYFTTRKCWQENAYVSDLFWKDGECATVNAGRLQAANRWMFRVCPIASNVNNSIITNRITIILYRYLKPFKSTVCDGIPYFKIGSLCGFKILICQFCCFNNRGGLITNLIPHEKPNQNLDKCEKCQKESKIIKGSLLIYGFYFFFGVLGLMLFSYNLRDLVFYNDKQLLHTILVVCGIILFLLSQWVMFSFL